MEIAKVTSKGQVTIPKEIREKLDLKCGDKMVFVEDGNRIYIYNSSDGIFKFENKTVSDRKNNM